jgi:S1-C subfamily serine protease
MALQDISDERFAPRPRRNPIVLVAAVAMLLVLLAGLIAGGIILWKRFGSETQVGLRESAPRSQPDSEERENIDLFKKAKASVVNVDTIAYRRGADRRIRATATETGSGFFWDDDGRIVTNYHVVEDAYLKPGQLSLRVVLADGSAYPATIVGTAADVDLAVIRIQATKEKIKKIAVGRSNDLEVGQKAYAIGNPFGLSLTLTKGIISALDREIESPSKRPIRGAIQIDAPINPGNSGGPLLDRDCRLIGVNTSIASPSGGNVGIGFAIPVDTVNAVVTELIGHGRTLRPDLGLTLADERSLRRAGYPTGVMIDEVEAGGPAAAAGLQPMGDATPGDLILRVNGQEITSNAQFDQIIAARRPGDRLTLDIERREKRMTVEVTVRGI